MGCIPHTLTADIPLDSNLDKAYKSSKYGIPIQVRDAFEKRVSPTKGDQQVATSDDDDDRHSWLGPGLPDISQQETLPGDLSTTGEKIPDKARFW